MKMFEVFKVFVLSNDMNPADDLPDPRELEMEAESMPAKVPLADYRAAMQAMKDKGYSYREVAEWIEKKLGVQITRHQVAYVLNIDPMIQELEERAEHDEKMMDDHDEQTFRP
ncbi:MAG: hypothetical protein ABIZ04_21160 [Opitutus sp.]